MSLAVKRLGCGARIARSEVFVFLTTLPFIAVGLWMVREPWRFKFVQWLGEDGIARIGWFGGSSQSGV